MPAATSFENVYQDSESASCSNSVPGVAYLPDCLMFVDGHRLELASASPTHPLKHRSRSGASTTATTSNQQQQQQQQSPPCTHRQSPSAPANTYRRRQHNQQQQQHHRSVNSKSYLQNSCGSCAYFHKEQKQLYGLDLDSAMCLCDDLSGLQYYSGTNEESNKQHQNQKEGSLRTNRHRYGDCHFSSDYYEDDDDEEEDDDDEQQGQEHDSDDERHLNYDYYDVNHLRHQYNEYYDSQFLSMTPPTQHCLTIEELRSARTSCWLCGCNWQQDHISLDCQECGGYALTRPCPSCDGKCKQVWKRNITATHDQHKALWVGQCALQPSQQEQRSRPGRTTLAAS